MSKRDPNPALVSAELRFADGKRFEVPITGQVARLFKRTLYPALCEDEKNGTLSHFCDRFDINIGQPYNDSLT